MARIPKYISNSSYPTQVNISRIAQISESVLRTNVDILVLGGGLGFWELLGRPDIYFSVLEKFLNRLCRRGRTISYLEAKLLEIVSKEEFLSD